MYQKVRRFALCYFLPSLVLTYVIGLYMATRVPNIYIHPLWGGRATLSHHTADGKKHMHVTVWESAGSTMVGASATNCNCPSTQPDPEFDHGRLPYWSEARRKCGSGLDNALAHFKGNHFHENAYGFPWRSNRAPSELFPIDASKSARSLIPQERMPFAIILPGFLANAAFYALVGFLFKTAYRLHVRESRWRRRLCLECGYDIRGNEERCSECGAPIPGRLIPEGLEAAAA